MHLSLKHVVALALFAAAAGLAAGYGIASSYLHTRATPQPIESR
jgi:hypothetical protein